MTSNAPTAEQNQPFSPLAAFSCVTLVPLRSNPGQNGPATASRAILENRTNNR